MVIFFSVLDCNNIMPRFRILLHTLLQGLLKDLPTNLNCLNVSNNKIMVFFSSFLDYNM